jgi:hypothetical protein
MRVLFVCPNLAAGGVERAWSILLPGLRDLVAQSVSGLYVGAAIARWRGARLVANEHSGGTLAPRREAMVRLLRPWIDVVAVVGSDQAHTYTRYNAGTQPVSWFYANHPDWVQFRCSASG